MGRILLTPEVSIPAHELWLYENQEAHGAVQRGLREADQGRVTRRGSFAELADDDVD